MGFEGTVIMVFTVPVTVEPAIGAWVPRGIFSTVKRSRSTLLGTLLSVVCIVSTMLLFRATTVMTRTYETIWAWLGLINVWNKRNLLLNISGWCIWWRENPGEDEEHQWIPDTTTCVNDIAIAGVVYPSTTASKSCIQLYQAFTVTSNSRNRLMEQNVTTV